MKQVRVMISGGGTGGHIMPALALCEYIHSRFPHAVLWYIGRAGSMEERLMKNEKVQFKRLHAAPFRSGFAFIAFLAVLCVGLVEGSVLILKGNPDVIVGFGGYASAPLLLAGIILRRNVVVHEANAIPGKAVKMLVKLGARFAYGLDSDNPVMRQLRDRAEKKKGACFTGNPLRAAFTQPPGQADYGFTGLNPADPILMVLGGSQGARFLNLLVCNACAELKKRLPDLQIIHITGSADRDTVDSAYAMCDIRHYVTAFSDRINVLFEMADVVLSRAGALTISELCVAGLPAILVPYPFAAEKHQHENALLLAGKGGAIMIDQDEMNEHVLVDNVSSLCNNPDTMKHMGEINRSMAMPRAAENVWNFACNTHVYEQ